ncbi:MAG: efflux RND transporter periplasmic adaptor subunit [Holophagales bacterium]|jgi:RND family efflux transporter MFP subunit|nr:efflux RND transporter periplasmic adaptor subunit [Holophagales bacterium]
MTTKRVLLYAIPATAFLAAGAIALRHSADATPSSPTRPLALPVAAARVAAEGRVTTYPGREVVVGTDFPGRLERVAVEEKQRVKEGDLLAEIDVSEERATLAEAKARVAEAEADVRLAEVEIARARQLFEGKVGTKQAVDRAERDRDAARARRETAKAQVDALSARIAKGRVVAPIAGVVLAKHVSTGETVERGARVATIGDVDRLRVEAEVDEADTGKVRLGAPVVVKAEGEATRWQGTVEEIPDAVTGRKIKPQDPARPTDTRVLLVKVALASHEGLKLGRRVEVEIEEK